MWFTEFTLRGFHYKMLNLRLSRDNKRSGSGLFYCNVCIILTYRYYLWSVIAFFISTKNKIIFNKHYSQQGAAPMKTLFIFKCHLKYN